MTLFIVTNNSSRRLRCGFTLVEMLTVIGIIFLLISILLVSLNLAYKRATQSRMKFDIQTVSMALESYRSDMGDYPRIDYGDTVIMSAQNPGAVVLCTALLAPGNKAQDGYGNTTGGADSPAPGFTLRPGGQTYGPYVEAGRFKVGFDVNSGTNVAGKTESTSFLADKYGHPILYFRANLKAVIHSPPPAGQQAGGIVGQWRPGSPTAQPMYNFSDNPTAIGASWGNDSYGFIRMCLMLGNHTPTGSPNGMINVGETAATTAPYLLWSPGPDEQYGTDITSPTMQNNPSAWPTLIPNCDDATNFAPQ